MAAQFTTSQPQTSLPETGSNWPTAGSPIYLGYRVEIPEGWRALRVVWCQERAAPKKQAQPDTLAALNEGYVRFQVAVLLCRPGTDDAEAAREFRCCSDWEAACLDQDGQYLLPAQTRPAFALLPLATPNPKCPDQTKSRECLVLMPSIRFPLAEGETLPPIRMFVDRCEIEAA